MDIDLTKSLIAFACNQ